MKVTATVLQIRQDRAYVRVHKDSACSSCHNCPSKGACHPDLSLSDKPKTYEMYAENTIGAKVGDTVEIESANSFVLTLALLVFILPFVLAAVLYFVVSNTRLPFFEPNEAEMVAVVTFFVFFILFAVFANLFCKKYAKTSIHRIVKENGETAL